MTAEYRVRYMRAGYPQIIVGCESLQWALGYRQALLNLSNDFDNELAVRRLEYAVVEKYEPAWVVV